MAPWTRHAGALLLALGGFAARAQAPYPSQPTRVIVPFPPGGGTDVVARLLVDKVREATGWTFVVDNKAGAGGNIGLDAVAKSKPDGYTIGMGQTANLAINPTPYAKMPVLPDLPTVAESLRKGFDTSDWKLLVAPAGTPAEIVKRLNAEVEKAMSKPATLAQLLAEGSVPMGGSPQDAATCLKAEQQRWGHRRPRRSREGRLRFTSRQHTKETR